MIAAFKCSRCDRSATRMWDGNWLCRDHYDLASTGFLSTSVEIDIPPAAQDLAAELGALERLLKIARSDTGQSRRVANFLLAWWNASRDGGFDLTDLWNVDEAIAKDMVTVFGYVARTRHYPDALGLGAEFEDLVTRWRRPKRRARK